MKSIHRDNMTRTLNPSGSHQSFSLIYGHSRKAKEKPDELLPQISWPLT